MERFVPAKLHGYLDFLTVGHLHRRRRSLPRQGCPGVDDPVAGDGAVGRLLQHAHRLRLRQRLRQRPRAVDEDAPQLDAAFALTIGLSPWIFGTWRKGWNYWAPQTFAMSSELFFALTTKLDPE